MPFGVATSITLFLTIRIPPCPSLFHVDDGLVDWKESTWTKGDDGMVMDLPLTWQKRYHVKFWNKWSKWFTRGLRHLTQNYVHLKQRPEVSGRSFLKLLFIPDLRSHLYKSILWVSIMVVLYLCYIYICVFICFCLYLYVHHIYHMLIYEYMTPTQHKSCQQSGRYRG